ncbi:hypothetical protein Trydic_g10106 [Trypoxylus dichotomus]
MWCLQNPSRDEEKDENQYISIEETEQDWIPAEEQIQEGQEEDIQLGEGSDQTISGRDIQIPVKLKHYILNSEDETSLIYQEDTNGPEKNQWIEAIREEKESLLNNQTLIHIDKNEAILRPVTTPTFSNDIGEDKKTSQICSYREAVDILLHLVNKTRADISYAVNFCSQRMENPTEQDTVDVKRLSGPMENSSIGGSRANGIVHQFSNVYTPQQNGVAERYNRTVIERAKYMLLDANLEKAYWAKAVNMAVYIIDRSPTRSLKERTPEEAWSGKKADLSDLKIFGPHPQGEAWQVGFEVIEAHICWICR